MIECDYHGCQEPPSPLPPTDGSWHLCKGHQAQLEEIGARVPFDPKALVGFWARGHDREKVVKEITDSTVGLHATVAKEIKGGPK